MNAAYESGRKKAREHLARRPATEAQKRTVRVLLAAERESQRRAA